MSGNYCSNMKLTKEEHGLNWKATQIYARKIIPALRWYIRLCFDVECGD